MKKMFMVIASLLSGIILYAQDSGITGSNTNFKKEHPEFVLKFEEKAKKIFKTTELKGDLLFAVVDEDGLLYSFALNEHIQNGTASTLDNNSPIYIASATKSFTGTLLRILDEKGKLDLDTSLATYLPDLNFRDSIDTEKINLRSLLNHTSGTFSTPLAWKTAFLGYSGQNSELINDLNTDFQYDPSRVFRYSNVGPIVAGIVVEKITGNSWKEEMKESIFEPLNMSSTSANVSDFDLENIRPSFTFSGEKGAVVSGIYKKDITMHASGGIISTVNDLSKWLSANIRQDETLLSKGSWSDLHVSTTPQDKDYFTYHRSGYSLGWDIAEYQGDTILTRFGGLAGYSFHISFMPEKNIGIIAYSSDNRAYLLPHLMANYAYNKLNAKAADSIFGTEKLKFDESFTSENELDHSGQHLVLAGNTDNDKILGTYQSSSGWPVISIERKDDYYIFNWGILTGKVYKTEDAYMSNMGVLDREFKIENDTLETGSLLYLKK